MYNYGVYIPCPKHTVTIILLMFVDIIYIHNRLKHAAMQLKQNAQKQQYN